MHHSTRLASLLLALALLFAVAMPAMAQHGAAAYQVLPPEYGPFSAHFLAGGEGLEKPVPAMDPLLKATTPWTMTAWVEMPEAPTKTTSDRRRGRRDGRRVAVYRGDEWAAGALVWQGQCADGERAFDTTAVAFCGCGLRWTDRPSVLRWHPMLRRER